ncbi:MAG TPA: tyrosine-type recombinase/integrase, partial [Trebonia sp.]
MNAVQTGLRLSEVTGLTIQDVTTTTPGAAVRTTGKGRKERATPLTRQTAAVLRAWLPEAGPAPSGPAFPTRRGTRMSADAVQRLVAKHAAAAARDCPSITSKHVTPLSRPGARFRCCHRPVSPDRSPNPPYRSLGNGLSTLPAVRRGSQVA